MTTGNEHYLIFTFSNWPGINQHPPLLWKVSSTKLDLALALMLETCPPLPQGVGCGSFIEKDVRKLLL